MYYTAVVNSLFDTNVVVVVRNGGERRPNPADVQTDRSQEHGGAAIQDGRRGRKGESNYTDTSGRLTRLSWNVHISSVTCI